MVGREPAVSVVLPVWNGERFLADAIESVTRQTLEAFELLVVDDGSTDRTRAIALEFSRNDPRVTVIPIVHAGIAEALNTGILAARGRFIARMDADDYSLPSRLIKQMTFLDAHTGCVVVGCNVEVIDEEGEHIGAVRFPERHPEITGALMTGRGAVAHPAVMMRKEAVLGVGGYRAERFPSEDLDLWMRLSEIGDFANIPEVLLRYRRHVNTVGVRERMRQLATADTIVHADRLRRGLRPLKRRRVSVTNPAAIYHFECAGIALRAGRRLATIRHAGATIAAAPLWPRPYAALAACALPRRAIALLVKAYARVRTMRS